MRLTPRASENRVVGERDGVLLVRVTDPPLEDRANRALCRLVAKRLGVGARSVTVARGARAREKVLRVEGLSAGEVWERLGLAPSRERDPPSGGGCGRGG